MDRDNYNLEDYDDINSEDDDFSDVEDSGLEDDEFIVMIGDLREDQSGELYVITRVNDDISTVDDKYFYVVKWSGVTLTNVSESFLEDCKLIKRFDSWKDAIISEEFDL